MKQQQIIVLNKKTKRHIEDIRMITICLESGGYATISTGEDLKKPFEQSKLTHKLSDLKIDIFCNYKGVNYDKKA